MGDVNWGWVFSGIIMAVTLANILYTWISQAKLARDKDVQGHGDRLTVIETQLKAMPTSSEFHKMQVTMGIMEQQMKTIAATVARIDHFLLEQASKGRQR